jgi:hypothetical protein
LLRKITKWITACACLAFTACIAPAQQHVLPLIPIGGLDPAENPSLLATPPVSRFREEPLWVAEDDAVLNPVFPATVRGQDDKAFTPSRRK